MEPVELLDRQYERLVDADGPAFVRELIRYHAFISDGPAPVVQALDELRQEAVEAQERFDAHSAELEVELVQLRRELVDIAPEADDSGVLRPDSPVPNYGWAFTLANFDALVDERQDRILIPQGWDRTVASMLLRILEQKLRRLQWVIEDEGPVTRMSEVNLRPDLDELRRRLGNVGERHRHAAQEYSLAVETHAGFQITVLDVMVEETNPAVRLINTDEDEHARFDEMFRRVAAGLHVLETAAAGRDLDNTNREMLELLVTRAKSAAEHVNEGIRMRLATLVEIPAAGADAYSTRLRGWLVSPAYALIGGPAIGGLLTQFATGERAGRLLFLGVAVLGLVIPPAVRKPVFILPRSRASAAFIALATAAVVVALLLEGLLAAVALFAVASAAFILGRHAS